MRATKPSKFPPDQAVDFIDHFPRGFIPLLNGGNLAIMYCFSCLYFACAGGGPWSLDALIWKKS